MDDPLCKKAQVLSYYTVNVKNHAFKNGLFCFNLVDFELKRDCLLGKNIKKNTILNFVQKASFSAALLAVYLTGVLWKERFM